MAATYKIEIVRGDDWAGAKFRWKDADGVPVPLASARLHIRDDIDAASTQLALANGSGLDITTEVGTVIPTITKVQSAALSNGVYDVEATSTGGKTKTLAQGKVVIIKDVSRS